jgi:hypothetical protein
MDGSCFPKVAESTQALTGEKGSINSFDFRLSASLWQNTAQHLASKGLL